MKKFLMLGLFFALAGCTASQQELTLSPLFSDHLVLQRDTTVAIWGTATPGVMVTVMGGWGTDARVETAATDGRWQVELETGQAGGPFKIQVYGGIRTLEINDVMIGEVWLASGQSNMEMPLAGWPPNDPIDDSAAEIAAANNPNLRMFTVEKTVAEAPTSDLQGSWAVASPETAGAFSATAYYFAQKVQETLDVPVGIIHTSWGGTPAEAWTARGHLEELEDFTEVLEAMDASRSEREALQSWRDARKQVTVQDRPEATRWTNLDFSDAHLAGADLDTGSWPQMELPTYWENQLGAFDGAVWFRRTLEIPEAWDGQALTLELGPIDDMDQTYFAGHRVGAHEGTEQWNAPRIYAVPDSIVRAGPQTIAVRVIDPQGGGGIYGPAEQMRIYKAREPATALALAGFWAYLPVAEYAQGRFFSYEADPETWASRPQVKVPLNQYASTVLFNGMIEPVAPYTIKGVIWYQGESNVGRAEQYQRLFPKMIESWRAAWDREDLPFYFVQIAPYQYSGPENTESAELREAQRLTQTVPNTGMVVTLDVGNVENIHPGNKKTVGHRLAGWALAQTYGHADVAFSGPRAEALTVDGRQARVRFSEIGEGLRAKSNPLTGFEIAGADGVFAPARASIVRDEVVVSSPRVRTPVAVRYAWTNGAEATLFNAAGLPASSFSLSLSQ